MLNLRPCSLLWSWNSSITANIPHFRRGTTYIYYEMIKIILMMYLFLGACDVITGRQLITAARYCLINPVSAPSRNVSLN